MKYFIILSTLIAANLFANGRQNNETGWSYDISTQSAYYFLEILTIDGTPAVGDGGITDPVLGDYCSDNLNECDVIGTFVADDDGVNGGDPICIGWQYALETGFSEVGAHMDDGSDWTAGYATSGEVPFFKVYDASNQSILDITPGSEVPGCANLTFPQVTGTSTATNTFGCADAAACDFDAGATADDGSCNYTDCAGACTCDVNDATDASCGSLEDNCFDCDADPSNDCAQDCAGTWGGPAYNDCNGDCSSTSSIVNGTGGSGNSLDSMGNDACGVCGGDQLSCTGCTNADSDTNYDPSNLFDDGSCTYTVPGATDLYTTDGPNRVILNWTAPVDNFTESTASYTYDVYMGGVYNKTTGQVQTQVTGLSPGNYCFYVVAIHGEYGASSDNSTTLSAGSDCGNATEVTGPTWRLQLVATIDSYDQFQFSGNTAEQWLLTDHENYLGAAGDASWGYDSNHDTPEPPNGPGDYIKLFFDHPEWDVWATHFTEDIVLDDDAFFSTNLTVWRGRIESNVPGSTTITIHVQSASELGSATAGVPSNYEMYIELDGQYTRILQNWSCSDVQYATEATCTAALEVWYSGDTVIPFYMVGAGQREFAVYIGNIPPQAPVNLSSAGHYESITVDWDADGADLNEIGDRYPATSYNVYRDNEPADPNSNSGQNDGDGPGGCSGVWGDALLTFNASYLNQTYTEDNVTYNYQYHDNANLYPDYNSWDNAGNATTEGLLQESTYSYTVTGNNLAGESSEGHTLRESGGTSAICTGAGASQSCVDPATGEDYPDSYDGDTWNAGRSSTTSALTGLNADPVSVPAHMFSNNATNIDTDGNTSTPDGVYEIPHDNSPGANPIRIDIAAWESTDSDYPYNNPYEFTFTWSQTAGLNDLTNVLGINTMQLHFNVRHLHADYSCTDVATGAAVVANSYEACIGDGTLGTAWSGPDNTPKSYTWQLLAESKHPVRVELNPTTNTTSGVDYYSGCGGWTAALDLHADSTVIDIVIHPEPNQNPTAADARDLTRMGDGSSVETSDDYDNAAAPGNAGGSNDFNDYEGAANLTDGVSNLTVQNGVWYEPHDNNIIDDGSVGLINASNPADGNNSPFGNNSADLYFSAAESTDADGTCDGSPFAGCPYPDDDGIYYVEDCGGFCSDGQYASETDCTGASEVWTDDNDCIPESWVGDGTCDGVDQPYGADLTCHEAGTGIPDGGDCDGNACPSGSIEDCVDSTLCWPEPWLNDGFCDDESSEWGAVLTCYPLEDNDCAGARASEKNFTGLMNREGTINGGGRAAQNFCDEQIYEWYWATASSAGLNFVDMNNNGIFDIGEFFTLIDNNATVQEFRSEEFWDNDNSGFWTEGEGYVDANDNLVFDVGTDLGSYLPPGKTQFGLCTGCADSVFTFTQPVDPTPGVYAHGNRDLHAEFPDNNYILSLKVTDAYGDVDYRSMLFIVKNERNQAPEAYAHREQPTWIMDYGQNDRTVYVATTDCDTAVDGCAGCDNLGAEDDDNDSVLYEWLYTGDDTNPIEAIVGGGINTDDPHIYDGDANLWDGVDNGWKEVRAELSVGQHRFTFVVTDSYGATDTAYTDFTIVNEPAAMTANIDIVHTALKHTIIQVSEVKQPDYDVDCHGEVYGEGTSAGNDWNTSRLDLYRETENDGTGTRDSLTSWTTTMHDGADSGMKEWIDESLTAETDFEYTVESFNSDGYAQEEAQNYKTKATRTHDRPEVEVLTPNGMEIRSIGDNYDVIFITYFDLNDNDQWDEPGTECEPDCDLPTGGKYISKIDIIYLADGVDGADGIANSDDEEEKGDASCDPGINNPDWLVCQGVDQSSYNNKAGGSALQSSVCDSEDAAACALGLNSGGCSQNGTSWQDGACHDGDATLNYEIADNDGEEVNYNAKVRVRVTDVGDYNGGTISIQTHEDDTDDPFTMAAHTITKDYGDGWHLVGPPVVPWADIGGNILVENFTPSFGTWGAEWVAFDVNGTYDDLFLTLGEGYYVALADYETLTQSGDPVIADPDCNDYVTLTNATCTDNSFASADITLQRGWNLIANPLVNKVFKEKFSVIDAATGEAKAFNDAVDAGWIAPTIYGWFENSYVSIDRIMKFGGYWINTSKILTLQVRPHLFENGELTRKAEDMVTSVLELRARDISGDGISDFITIGLAENAVDEFVYGEDEYDLPRQAYASMGGEFIDMKVGSDLMRDIKSAEYDDFQAWTISIEREKVDNDIELSWGDVSGFEADLHIVINGEAINMHAQNTLELSTMIDEAAIVVGNVDSYLNPIPDEFGLSAAYPNPFNPTTTLGLALNADGFVSMSVYNIRGQVVEVLVDRNMNAGYHNIIWNADGISSGMYFVRVETGANAAIQKLMLLK